MGKVFRKTSEECPWNESLGSLENTRSSLGHFRLGCVFTPGEKYTAVQSLHHLGLIYILL